jgi:branched-chain amino acid transport system permease protein
MTTVWAGLAIGGIYAIAALGYNLVFVAAGVFNFAQAQVMMVGTFMAYLGARDIGMPLVLVPIFSFVVGFALGFASERIAIAPVAGRGGHAVLVTTLGVAILLDGVMSQIFGSNPLSVPFYGSDNITTFLGGRAAPSDFSLMVFAVVVAAILYLAKTRTLTGRMAQASSEDRFAARLRGVNTGRLGWLSAAAAGGLAGLAGILVAQTTYAVADLGDLLAVKAFLVLAVGGFGSEIGAVAGGFTVGLIEAETTRYLNASYADLILFGILLLVLLVRPSGVFVKHRERMV